MPVNATAHVDSAGLPGNSLAFHQQRTEPQTTPTSPKEYTMFPHHDLDFINALRREREAEAAQHRLARSVRRTRSSRRWPLARYRTRGSAPTSSHSRSGSPASLPARIMRKEAESASAPCH